MFKTQVEPKPQASGFTAKFHFLWSIRVKTMESFSWHVLSSIFGEVPWKIARQRNRSVIIKYRFDFVYVLNFALNYIYAPLKPVG